MNEHWQAKASMEPLNGPDCIPVSCVAAETRYPGNLFGDAEATSYIFFPAVEVCKPRDQRSGGRRRHPGRGLLCARSFNKVLPASSHAPPPSLSACVSGEAATRHTGPRWWARVATGTTDKGRRAYRDFFCLNFFVQASRWGRLWVLLIHPREVVQQSNGSVKEEKRYIWSGVQ